MTLNGITIINTTPHTVTVMTARRQVLATLPVSEYIARVEERRALAYLINGLPVYDTRYGEVIGLPEPRPGVLYVVSRPVKRALPGRDDLLCPGKIMFDDRGNIIGCMELSL